MQYELIMKLIKTECLLIVSFGFQGVLLTAVNMTKCKYGEDLQYNATKRCDGVWDCPLHGGDERDCRRCKGGLFECSHGSSSCYDEKERCNGRAHCANKADENLCSKDKCGPNNGTFLCQNLKCIKEAWKCDSTDDCGDNSDEKNCPVLASRKVIIAAVVGALMCGLLLTIALGCTCRLYTLHNPNRGDAYTSPVVEIEEEIWRRQSAPPNYEEAMSSSWPVDGSVEESVNDCSGHAEDDDVPLLDTHDSHNPGRFNDDDLLDAVEASGNYSSGTNERNNPQSEGLSGIVLVSGKRPRAYWQRIHRESPGSIQEDNANMCDTCAAGVAPLNEPLNTPCALNESSCENSLFEDRILVGVCRNCSGRATDNCGCIPGLQSTPSLGAMSLKEDAFNVDQHTMMVEPKMNQLL